MLQTRSVLVILALLAHLAACQSSVTNQEQQDRAMYQVVIDTFFCDDHVQRLFQEDVLERKIVYIQPTFLNSDVPIPDTILKMITAHTTAQGLVQVQNEQPGGAKISLSAIGNDAAAATVYNQHGPTIQMSAQISGTSCGASIGIGYLLTPNDAGWQAQDYVQAVC
jgi:hypothetical protein